MGKFYKINEIINITAYDFFFKSYHVCPKTKLEIFQSIEMILFLIEKNK